MKSLFILYVIFFSTIAFAQHEQLTILSSTGSVYCMSGELTGKQLRTGMKITKGTIVKLEQKSFCSFISSDGSHCELKLAGTYNTETLFQVHKGGSNSTLKKFADYMTKEMLNTSKDSRDMKTLGSVERLKPNVIEVDFPSNSYIVDTLPIIRWFPPKNNLKYFFQLKSFDGRTVYLKVVQDTCISFNIYDLHLEREQCYYWKVFTTGVDAFSSDSSCLRLYNLVETKQITDTIAQLKDAGLEENSATDQMMLANYYRSRMLFTEAITCYSKALHYAPEAIEFRKQYVLFLVSIGMEKKALLLLKEF